MEVEEEEVEREVVASVDEEALRVEDTTRHDRKLERLGVIRLNLRVNQQRKVVVGPEFANTSDPDGSPVRKVVVGPGPKKGSLSIRESTDEREIRYEGVVLSSEG